MSLRKKQMLDLISEEYNKRVNYYLNLSEIEIRDKNDNDLISSAKGLKLKDRAGFLYTVVGIVKNEKGEDCLRLAKPGVPSSEEYASPQGSLPIYETEEESEKLQKLKSGKKSQKEKNGKSPEVSSDIISKSKDVDYKRSFVPDMSKSSAIDDFGIEGDNVEYIDVPINQKELDNFTLWKI